MVVEPYLSSPSGLIGVASKTNGNNLCYKYILTDHLGSIQTILSENANIENEFSFDPWGRSRNANDWSINSTSIPEFSRGFTGHEHLLEFGLINMNGRLYDPLIGRMLSPDNFVQNPESSLGFNRYMYCSNNPLGYTDPGGEWSGWDDLIVAGIGFTFGYVSYGIINDDWGWNAAAAGALSSGTFLLGYYTSGTAIIANDIYQMGSIQIGGSSFANMTALTYSLNMAATSTVNLFMPAFSLSDEYAGISISPALTPYGFALNFNGYEKFGDLTVNIGFNTNGDCFTSTTYAFSDNFAMGWYRTDFVGDQPQGVAGVGFYGKDWTIRIDEDFGALGGDGDDRWRTGGFDASIGNFSFGARVQTNDLTEAQEKNLTENYWDPIKNVYKVSPRSVYRDGEVIQSVAWVGYRSKYGVLALEHNNPVYQATLQNGIHKFQGTPYFQATKFNYFTITANRYNPYSVYYY